MDSTFGHSVQAGEGTHTIGAIAEVYRTVLGDQGAIYCSAPVTSGKRYVAWLERTGKRLVDIDGADEGDRESHFAEVMQPNCTHAGQIVRKLRERTGRVIIDPTAMPYIPGWTQADWRAFWRRVIEEYVTDTVFVNDWQYSNGCAYEFWVAQKKGIPTMDERMCPIDLERGVEMIVEASAEMRRYGATTVFIDQVSRDLKEMVSVPTEPRAR